MKALKRILDNHSIEYIEQDGDIFAVDVYTQNGDLHCEWVNVSTVNIWEWLNY